MPRGFKISEVDALCKERDDLVRQLEQVEAVIEKVQKYRDGLPEEIVFALQDLEDARGR